MVDRVAYCGTLLRCCTERYRGFESYTIRQDWYALAFNVSIVGGTLPAPPN